MKRAILFGVGLIACIGLMAMAKAYEEIHYTGSMVIAGQETAIDLAVADGYIDASTMEMKNTHGGKARRFVYDGQYSDSQGRMKFAAAPARKKDVGYFVVEPFPSSGGEAPSQLLAQYVAGKKSKNMARDIVLKKAGE